MRKRFLIPLLLAGSALALAPPLSAKQDLPADSQKLATEDEQGDSMKWKLINTGIFAILLGFGVMAMAPKFFQARSLEIQKAIKEATGLKIEADFRYSEIDKKMSNLSGEVAQMKAQAALEIEREHQRMKQETAQEIATLGRNIENEIDSLRAEGALQVKQHTAELALALAERRLQSHFAQEDGGNGIREFVGLVGLGGKN